MPYKNNEREKLCNRAINRTRRHGNWRQTYVDCMGMCCAQVKEDNGEYYPCGQTEQLELHDQWGENHSSNGQGKFQKRFLICNHHHAIIDDRAHPTSLIEMQFHMSRLQEDVQLEMLLAGGYQKWVEKYHLDDSRAGCSLYEGPTIKEESDEEVCARV